MNSAFELLQRGSSVVYGTAGGLWVMVLFARPAAPDMWLARSSLQTLAERHPQGFPTVTWVLQQAGISMDDDARKAAVAVTDEFAKSIRAQATIIEGSGFQAATVRAIVSGMDALTRSAAPKKTFAEIGPAISWCASKRPVPDVSDAEAITKSLVSLRLKL